MITASFKPSLAASRPQTSDHLTFGFSVTIAELSAPCSFASSSSPPFSFGFFLAEAEAPPPPPPSPAPSSSGAI